MSFFLRTFVAAKRLLREMRGEWTRLTALQDGRSPMGRHEVAMGRHRVPIGRFAMGRAEPYRTPQAAIGDWQWAMGAGS